MTPDIFWDLTPFEFGCAVKAKMKNDDLVMQQKSFFTSYLINCWSKRNKKPKDLYKPMSFGKNKNSNKIKNLTGAPASFVREYYNKKLNKNIMK